MSELLKINVNDHTEKKNGLTYLSWAFAWAEVLKIDPGANWSASEYGPQGCEVPFMRLPDDSCMVRVTVTIKGQPKACLLPVMDHRNKAIKNPDAFAVNTAIMRCLTKAISMHGLGLYIYAGEDLPEDDASASKPLSGMASEIVGDWITYIREGKTGDDVKHRLAEATEAAKEVHDEMAYKAFRAAAIEHGKKVTA